MGFARAQPILRIVALAIAYVAALSTVSDGLHYR
jgi:hypothetical protein